MITIRSYDPSSDYPSLRKLYEDGSTFGGQFDPARDTQERCRSIQDKILLAELGGEIVGTVTLFEDSRAARLYRFAVDHRPDEQEIAGLLYDAACSLAKSLGHEQILVYAPCDDLLLQTRYMTMGMKQGSDYTCYRSTI